MWNLIKIAHFSRLMLLLKSAFWEIAGYAHGSARVLES
jgi:hypothetical protein